MRGWWGSAIAGITSPEAGRSSSSTERRAKCRTAKGESECAWVSKVCAWTMGITKQGLRVRPPSPPSASSQVVITADRNEPFGLVSSSLMLPCGLRKPASHRDKRCFQSRKPSEGHLEDTMARWFSRLRLECWISVNSLTPTKAVSPKLRLMRHLHF